LYTKRYIVVVIELGIVQIETHACLHDVVKHGFRFMTSTNGVSPSECQSGNLTSKPSKKDKFNLGKSPLPSGISKSGTRGNAFLNIQTSKSIPSIPQKEMLRSAECQPPNSMGLENISDESEPPNSVGLNKITMEHNMSVGLNKITMEHNMSPMRIVHPFPVPNLQDQSHPRNTVDNLHGWTVVSYRDKKVSPH
jgi:hypothetical protein